MEEYYENAIRNECIVINRGAGGGPAYNAVLSKSFSDEQPGAGAVTEPVTLQEAKDWAKIDVSDDDALITRLIKGARRICETYVNLSFIERTVTAKIHNGLGDITLPYGPVTSDVAYSNIDETEATDYDITHGSSGNVVAVYSAGYAAGELPEDLRTALLCQIAWMYNNRGDIKLATSLSLESMLILKPLRDVS